MTDDCVPELFSKVNAHMFLYLLMILLGSGGRSDPSRNDSHSNTHPANGGDGKGSYSNSPCGAAR